jgi:hypothetical protein
MPKIQAIKPESDSLLMKNIPNEIVENLNQIIKITIQEEGLDPSSIMLVTTNVMSALGKYKTISGADKKKLVILIINEVIDRTNLDESTQIILQTMVKTTIPTTIDLFVAVSKGKYKFKNVTRFFTLHCCK